MLDGRIHGFPMYCVHYFVNVYFGKFVMKFIDIGEIGCMSIPKCHWMVIMVNLFKQTWFFAWCCLLVWFCVCQVSIWVFSPLTVIHAARRRSMLDTKCCRRSTWTFAHLSSRAWRSSPRFWGGLSKLVIARPISPNMFYGAAVWRSCRLLHLGDIALLKKIKDY